MKKIYLAALVSLFMGFVGLFVGTFFDDYFGGADFAFSPIMSVIFVIITMGAFILHSIENKK